MPCGKSADGTCVRQENHCFHRDRQVQCIMNAYGASARPKLFRGRKAVQQDDPAACWEANAETWTRQARAGYDVYRDVVNTPAFFAMLPSVVGRSGLDVGCGEGGNTRKIARLGARMRAVVVLPTPRTPVSM